MRDGTIFHSVFMVICPVQPLPKKQIPSRSPQISTKNPAVSSLMRGGSRSSRTRDGMRWARQRQAREVVRRAVIRERARRARRRRCSVRQNRVVLASVADVKLPVVNLIQPGRSAIKPAGMEAKGIRLQGERGISRQTIAQGMPECSSCTCMLVCATLYTIAHETAGAASTRHSLLPLFRGTRFMQTSGASRAASR
jgi:hypothetical protein